MTSALSYAASDGWLAFEAPAKINLYLGVYTEKDERGYHRVDSVMTAVDISDKVFVRPAKDLSVSCNPSAHVPQEKNTCWKAAQAFASMFSYDASVEIHIEKHIPSQAGLGGASADAAAVLCALCELSGIDTADTRVSEGGASGRGRRAIFPIWKALLFCWSGRCAGGGVCCARSSSRGACTPARTRCFYAGCLCRL